MAQLPTDIGDVEQCRALAELAVDRFGAVDGVVQVAAYDGLLAGLDGTERRRVACGARHQRRRIDARDHRDDRGDGRPRWLDRAHRLAELGAAAGDGAARVRVVEGRAARGDVPPGQGARSAQDPRQHVVPTWMWGPPVQMYVQWQVADRGITEEEAIGEITANMPLGEIPADEDVAESAVFLCSDRARMITGPDALRELGRVHDVSGRVSAYEHLLAPGRIGALELRNRMVMAPMGEDLGDLDGMVSGAQMAYLEARARGGLAMVMLGSVAVSFPVGCSNARQTAISDERHVAGWQEAARRVHRPRSGARHAAHPDRRQQPAGHARRTADVGGVGAGAAGARRPLRDGHRGRGRQDDGAVRRARLQALLQGARPRRHRVGDRRLRIGGRARPRGRASTAASCTPGTATSSTASCRRPRTTAPTSTAGRWSTARACWSRSSDEIRAAGGRRLRGVGAG